MKNGANTTHASEAAMLIHESISNPDALLKLFVAVGRIPKFWYGCASGRLRWVPGTKSP